MKIENYKLKITKDSTYETERLIIRPTTTEDAEFIYEVMNSSSKMNGWLASEVTYGNNRGAKLGTFVETENKAWQEISLKDGMHNFTETHRDQWSVYLQDKSRNVFIQLDLHTKKVMYSLGNKTKTYLYSISAAK